MHQQQQDQYLAQLLLQQQQQQHLVQQHLAAQQQQPRHLLPQEIQQVQPVHEVVAEEQACQLAMAGAGEVHGVETQVSEDELGRAVEVLQPVNSGVQKTVEQVAEVRKVNNKLVSGEPGTQEQAREERDKVSSVSPQPAQCVPCPGPPRASLPPLVCTHPPLPPLPAWLTAPVIFLPDPDRDSELSGREARRRGSLPVAPPPLTFPALPPLRQRSADTSPAHLAVPSYSHLAGLRRRSADPSELSRARQSLTARLAASAPFHWEEPLPALLEQRRASGGGGQGGLLAPLWEGGALSSQLSAMFTIREARAWSHSDTSLTSAQVTPSLTPPPRAPSSPTLTPASLRANNSLPLSFAILG